jgi:FkbM family methyltransferase
MIRSISGFILPKIKAALFSLHTLGFRGKTVKLITRGSTSFKLVLKPENGYLDAFIYAYGLYEPGIVTTFEKHVNEGDICIDVGANIGHHSIIMSQLVGPKGKVFAYEPIPAMREQMNESLELNKITNVTIIENALSDAPGILHLHVNTSNVAGSSFVNSNQGSDISVEVRTLDSFTYPVVNFMKIDVEGFEYHVLLGAKETILRCKPRILLEYSPEYYARYDNTHSEKIVSFLSDLGYKLFDLDNDTRAIIDQAAFLAEFGDGLRSQTNILALPV